MLHRDDDWPLGTRDSEANRWALIRKYGPEVAERIPHKAMIPGPSPYNAEQEAIFHREWRAYRNAK